MSHPALGLPPADPTAGLPAAAAQLRANRARLTGVGLEEALRRDPSLTERHDELALRELLRDSERHLEQLAQALETGEARFVTAYAETGQGAVILINANDDSGAVKRVVEVIAQEYHWSGP